jgi:hypothetical protein
MRNLLVPIITGLVLLLLGSDYTSAEPSTAKRQEAYVPGPARLPSGYDGFTWNASALAIGKSSAKGKVSNIAAAGRADASKGLRDDGGPEALQKDGPRIPADVPVKVPESDMFFLLFVALAAIALLKKNWTKAFN